MKILLVTQNYTPEVAAAPIRLHNMVSALTKRGIDFDVLTAMPNYPKGQIFDGYRGNFYCKERIERVDVYRYWIYANISYSKIKRGLSMISFALTLLLFGLKRKKIKSYDAVIVQTPPLFVAYTAVWLFKSIYHKKIYLNVSDIHPQSLAEGEILSSESGFYKKLLKVENYLYKKSDSCICQSDEIVNHIKKHKDIDCFLYRTLQDNSNINLHEDNRSVHNKIVYAGLLAKTQDILSIVKTIDFANLGLEFHIYGDGGQKDEIINYCDDQSVFYHGFVSNDVMLQELQKYDASIVPLSKSLVGAVPSKIYNVVASGLPLIFMGKEDGEAANLIKKYKLGFTVPSSDYDALKEALKQYSSLTNEAYNQLRNNCKQVSENDFNFDKQIDRLVGWLNFK